MSSSVGHPYCRGKNYNGLFFVCVLGMVLGKQKGLAEFIP